MKPVVVVVAFAVGVALAPSAAAFCAPTHVVAVGPAGPLLPEFHVLPGARIGLEERTDGLQTRLIFDSPPCETVRPFPVGVPGALACQLDEPGRHPYRVEGFGAGTGVVVVDPVDWVTIRAARTTVVFGDTIHLRGTAYGGGYCGPPRSEPWHVRLDARPVTAPGFVRLASPPMPSRTLRWGISLAPRVGTLYRAVWNTHTSAVVRVDVRPRVTLGRAAGGRLRAAVRSTRSYRGRWVAVQRRTARGWRFVRAVRLGRGSATRFGAPHRRGLVRVYVPRAVAGRGYVAGFSRPLRLR